MVSTMVYVHTILRDVAGLFKVGRLVAYHSLLDLVVNVLLLTCKYVCVAAATIISPLVERVRDGL